MQRCLKHYKIHALLAFPPPDLHNVFIRDNLHDLFVEDSDLPGVANLHLKRVARSRPGDRHITPLSKQLPVVLPSWPPDYEVDIS